jgi:50S ribosomal protein L16 3-hydroxylase
MDFRDLFRAMGFDRFLRDYYLRLPLALPNVLEDLAWPGAWEEVTEVLHGGEATPLVVRDGAGLKGAPPTTVDEAKQLIADGWTINIRHAERHSRRLHELASGISSTFSSPVDIQMFITPAGKPGFSWHYDAEDVFILQTAGAKDYLLRKNTVNPWPLEETLPADMHYEREIMPLSCVRLAAGDMLYIPCGYWHQVQACHEDMNAISLAIGVMSRSAIDLLEFARKELPTSLLWRQRLPLVPRDGDLHAQRETLAELSRMLADDIAARLRNPHFIDQFVAAARGQALEGLRNTPTLGGGFEPTASA